MSGNRLEFDRIRAQGQTLLRIRISGPDVVGNAAVYYRLEEARRLWDLFGEEVVILEAEDK